MFHLRLGIRALFSMACVIGALGAGAMPIAAQASAAEKAAAESLFDAGLSLMKKGEYEEACSKLEQSQAIERGIGTMLYLAECYAKVGRTASAWATFREAASLAEAQGQHSRATAGSARADELEPVLSKLTVVVAEDNNAVPGFELQLDGFPLGTNMAGNPFPVDPGRHVVTAVAPGYEEWSEQIAVAGAAVSVTVQVPPLVVDPGAQVAAEGGSAAPDDRSDPIAGADVGAPADARAPPSGIAPTGQHLAGLITGGVGIIALGVGTVFGIQAISKNGEAEDSGDCPPDMDVCFGDAYNTWEEGNDAATLANVFVFGGLALVGAGAAIYLLAPSPDQPAEVALVPLLSADGRRAGLTVSGSF